MYALVIHSIISLVAGVLGGAVIGFTLRVRVWRLEHEQAKFEGQLTREVRARAGTARQDSEKISASVLKDIAALSVGKNNPELSREELRTGKRAERG